MIGAGTVGRATGIGLQTKGHLVSFFDTSPKVMAQLRTEGLTTATSVQDLIEESQIVFLCLPTPVLDGGYDLSHIEDCVKAIAGFVENQIVVLRSTVLPGTTRKLSSLIPSNKLACNPEFLRQASALEDFLNPYRIVIGVKSDDTKNALMRLYENFGAPIIATDWESAELSKLISNAYLAAKISFFNESWLLSGVLGIDPTTVEKIVSSDGRIGSYGTRGGLPFDGKCLPKDVLALQGFGKELGVELEILEAALRTNRRMNQHQPNLKAVTNMSRPVPIATKPIK